MKNSDSMREGKKRDLRMEKMEKWQKKNEKINLSYDKTNKKILSIEIHNYDSIIEYNLSNKIDFER